MTISKRVMLFLKKQPGTPKEIAEALRLTKRDTLYDSYRWGRWSFSDAEEKGLIEWKDGQWHLKEVE